MERYMVYCFPVCNTERNRFLTETANAAAVVKKICLMRSYELALDN